MRSQALRTFKSVVLRSDEHRHLADSGRGHAGSIADLGEECMSRTPAMTETARAAKDGAHRVERRRHSRYPAQGEVVVYWQNKSGLPCDSSAVLRNVSAFGFAIELVERFPVGGAVTVRTAERSLQCTVRHVQKYPNSFLVGLEVLGTSDGSACERSLQGLSSALSNSLA